MIDDHSRDDLENVSNKVLFVYDNNRIYLSIILGYAKACQGIRVGVFIFLSSKTKLN